MKKTQSSTQLQTSTPEKKRDTSRRMDLAIVPSSSPLPDGWIERSIRNRRGRTDKYYHEPGTGRKFRSLPSVRRYLMELDNYDITTKEQNHNQITVYRKTYIPKHQVKIDRSKPLKLPDGWFIRTITRMSGHSMGRVDKYYCERSTGRVFRSRLDVQRYLADNYIEENTTLTELYKPASLIQMSRSDKKDLHEENAMAIVPHSSYKDSYSSIFDDVTLKDLVRKSDDVPLKDHVPESDNVPLKELLRKSPAKRTSKNSNKSASPKRNNLSYTPETNASSLANPHMKVKWVLKGPRGDAWSPFIGDTMVPKSLNQEWAQMFTEIVSQKQSNGSSSDAQD